MKKKFVPKVRRVPVAPQERVYQRDAWTPAEPWHYPNPYYPNRDDGFANPEESKAFLAEVFAADNPPGEAHVSVSWGGTDARVDLHCQCGLHSIFEGFGIEFFRCIGCGNYYALGKVVKLIPLSAEQVAESDRHNICYAMPQTPDGS